MTIEKALVAKRAWHFPRANAENATIETNEKGITIRGGNGQYIELSTADLVAILRLVDEVHGLTRKEDGEPQQEQTPIWEYRGGATVRTGGGGTMGINFYGPFPEPNHRPENGEYEIALTLARRINEQESA